MAAAVPLALTACSSQGGGQTQTEDGKTILSLWTHSAGNELEMNVISQIVDDFNESQSDYVVQRQDFPQDAYNDSVQGAAAREPAAVHPGRRWADHAELGLERMACSDGTHRR